MLTKYILQIGEAKHEITSENIRNWDQIQCAYSRKDFNGVIRSYSSKFEFVGKAYDMLLAYYLEHGVNASAMLTVLTITDRWEWEPQFEAPLDFSTITWDGLVLGISAIDNSLGALINARKSTTYEMVVGEDIMSGMKLDFDRLLMSNAVTHEIMSNTDREKPNKAKEGDILLTHSTKFKRVPTYVVGEGETYENSPISFQDESDEEGSYFLKVEQTTDFNLEIDITFSPLTDFHATTKKVEIHLMRFDASNPNYNNSYVDLGTVLSYDKNEEMTVVGCFSSLEALKEAYPNPGEGWCAVIGKSTKREDVEAVYATPYTNLPKKDWLLSEWPTYRGMFRRYIYSLPLSGLPSGTLLGLFYKSDMSTSPFHDVSVFIISKSSIKTTWKSRAKAISIDSLTPINVAQELVKRVTDGKLNVDVHISPYDTRIANTAILAAESVRGIPNAKLYTSFNDFCDFMQTVFGYTYYLGDFHKSEFVGAEPFEPLVLGEDQTLLNEECPEGNRLGRPWFIVGSDVFAVRHIPTGNLYTIWDAKGSAKDSSAYNDASGHARRDKVFVQDIVKHSYYIDSEGELQYYYGNPELCHLDRQPLFFVHRKELFSGEDVRPIGMCRDLSYSVDNSLIYSNLEIGYDKQEYEAQCGRDEWNFTNRYTTGIDISNKTLSLKSKYRADCYGLEFLAQKRAKDDTDDKSDNTVFFVHCEVEDEGVAAEDDNDAGEGEEEVEGKVQSLKIKRSATIEGALSDTVFNGEYSPHRCLLANADYIAAMGVPTSLKFASSDGNSEIKIDGVGCDSDFTLESQLFSCGEVSFTTGDVDFPQDTNALLSVTHMGVRYRGYLTSLTLRYARTEAAKYKLIVKDIELC